MSEFRTRVRSALRPDYVVVALALAAVAVGIALAILLPGAGAKIVAVVASAAIGLVVRMLGKRASMEWTLKRYRDLAARDPLALFHDKPPVEAPALESRTRLMDAVVAELDAQRRPGRELSPVVVPGLRRSGHAWRLPIESMRRARSST